MYAHVQLSLGDMSWILDHCCGGWLLLWCCCLGSCPTLYQHACGHRGSMAAMRSHNHHTWCSRVLLERQPSSSGTSIGVVTKHCQGSSTWFRCGNVNNVLQLQTLLHCQGGAWCARKLNETVCVTLVTSRSTVAKATSGSTQDCGAWLAGNMRSKCFTHCARVVGQLFVAWSRGQARG